MAGFGTALLRDQTQGKIQEATDALSAMYKAFKRDRDDTNHIPNNTTIVRSAKTGKGKDLYDALSKQDLQTLTVNKRCCDGIDVTIDLGTVSAPEIRTIDYSAALRLTLDYLYEEDPSHNEPLKTLTILAPDDLGLSVLFEVAHANMAHPRRAVGELILSANLDTKVIRKVAEQGGLYIVDDYIRIGRSVVYPCCSPYSMAVCCFCCCFSNPQYTEPDQTRINPYSSQEQLLGGHTGARKGGEAGYQGPPIGYY